MIFVGFAGVFGQLGVAPALVHLEDLSDADVRAGFSLSVSTGVILGGIIWAAAPLTSAYFSEPLVAPVARAIAFTFPIAGLGTVAEALLQRHLNFKALTVIAVVSYILGYALVASVCAASGAGVWSLVAGTLAQRGIQTISTFAAAPHSILPQFSLHRYQRLLRFGIGHTLAQIFNYTANQGDYAVVGRLFSAEILGVYSRSYQLMMLPARFLGQALDRVLFPVMARVQSENDRLASLFLNASLVVCMIVGPASVLMVLLAPEIVAVALGDNWAAAVVPFQILSCGVLFRTAYKISDTLAKACGAVYRRSFREALYALLVIGGSVVGARWGIRGVTIGVLFALTSNYVLASAASIRILRMTWRTFMRHQVGGLRLAMYTAVAAFLLRQGLGALSVGPLMILLVVSVSALTCALGILTLRPEWLGAEAAPVSRVLRRFIAVQIEAISHRIRAVT